jgi:serine/threonine protein kinase
MAAGELEAVRRPIGVFSKYSLSVAVPKARTVIRERYQLESMIGEGGMASVWRARDLTLARSVAVKLLFARDDRDRSALTARFLREARIAASVQHRNVIQIVDFGTTEDELPFMVMELLEGEPLSGRMHRERRLPVADVVQIANLTLRGLAAVHNTGIIHRDLKPDNVYLKREAQSVYPKILDFGISRSVEPQSGRRSALTTREGMIIGTPEYMSPEQARGVKDIDPRTDLYSMGVIMYECLTGRLPFHSENVGDLIIQVVTGTAPTVHELVPDVPLELSKVVEHAMARKREERFSSAVEMQSALLDVLDAGDRISRTFSDLPSLEVTEGSGTRRLTPSERVTLSDGDSLPLSRPLTEGDDPESARVTEDALDLDARRPTTDALGIIPPVTQTLQLRGYTQASRSRRNALLLMAVAAAAYTAFVLVYARLGGRPDTSAASAPTAEFAPSPPAASPANLTSEQPGSQRVQAAAAPVVEVRLGEPVEAAKPAVAPSKTKARNRTSKLRKAQGALRNLDF